jgi:kynurenine formamidase
MGCRVIRNSIIAAGAGAAIVAGAVAIGEGRAASSSPQNPVGASTPAPPMSRARYDAMLKELSNWGRWGKTDEIGTLNLITLAKRQQALALAKTATHVSLGRPAASPPYQLKMLIEPDSSVPMPFVHDRIEIDFHGGTFTHLDALCHIVYDGHIFNGYALKDAVNTTDGCTKNSVNNVNNGIITRAILVDIPRLRGTPYLEPGTRVTRADIEAWEMRAKVRVGPGDALLLRTGRWARPNRPGAEGGSAGWDLAGLPFLKERDVAVVGSDFAQEVANNIEPPNFPAVHKAIGNALGITMLDNLDLEHAAQMAERLNRWEFMIMIAPLRIPNGTGSPINPLAIF